MKNPVVVLGLGNPLMADEGIGIRLIERLMKMAAQYPGVDFVDGGTASLSVLHHIEGRRKAIFVDCALMGEEPGAMKRFTPDDVRTIKAMVGQSLHETDLLRILSLAERLDQAPREVVIFGIQPERIAPGENLSTTLSSRFDACLSRILCELRT